MRDFFFVHINRTGGSAIWPYLGSYSTHTPAQVYLETVGRDDWDRAYTFSFIRHPYDRAVSLYHHHLRQNLGNLYTDKVSFKEFVEIGILEQEKPYYNSPFNFGPQVMWLADLEGGDIIVQNLFTYERFEENVDLLLRDLGRKRTRPIPKISSTQHEPWQTYYLTKEGEEVKHMIDLAWMLDFQYLPYKPKVEPEEATKWK